MSDRERTAAEQLKHRIMNDTGEQIGTAARAMFDLFTGGAEAVGDCIAADLEAKHRGETGAPMMQRYRCNVCRGVHLAGQPCDRIVRDTEPAPPPSEAAPAHPRVVHALAQGVTIVCACEACALQHLDSGAFIEAEKKSVTFAQANLRACELCHAEQAGHALGFPVPRP
jgi:hypothetical protein